MSGTKNNNYLFNIAVVLILSALMGFSVQAPALSQDLASIGSTLGFFSVPVEGAGETDGESDTTSTTGTTGDTEVAAGDVGNVISTGNLEMLKKLIETGTISPNTSDDNGLTLLHFAVKSNQPEMVTYLISKGASVSAKDDRALMPIHYAALGNSPACARALVAGGADVNSKGFVSNDGVADSTPLHFAAEQGYCEVAEVLIELGGDVNAVSNFQRTPLFWAKKMNHPEMVTLLEQHGAVVDPPSTGTTGGTTTGGTTGTTTGGTTTGGTTGTTPGTTTGGTTGTTSGGTTGTTGSSTTGSTGGSTTSSGGSVNDEEPGDDEDPHMAERMNLAIQRIKQLQVGLAPRYGEINMDGATATHMNIRKVALLLRSRYQAVRNRGR